MLEDDDYIYMSLQLCEGGTMHSYIVERGDRLPESEVCDGRKVERGKRGERGKRREG